MTTATTNTTSGIIRTIITSTTCPRKSTFYIITSTSTTFSTTRTSRQYCTAAASTASCTITTFTRMSIMTTITMNSRLIFIFPTTSIFISNSCTKINSYILPTSTIVSMSDGLSSDINFCIRSTSTSWIIIPFIIKTNRPTTTY